MSVNFIIFVSIIPLLACTEHDEFTPQNQLQGGVTTSKDEFLLKAVLELLEENKAMRKEIDDLKDLTGIVNGLATKVNDMSLENEYCEKTTCDSLRVSIDMEQIRAIDQEGKIRDEIDINIEAISNNAKKIDTNTVSTDTNTESIESIHQKPRFVAEIRQLFGASGYYLPVGDITDYNELIDVDDNFNPSTGVFTVGNKEEDEGTYVFHLSGYKEGEYGKNGDIKVYINGFDNYQYTYESDTSHSLQMNDIMSFNLKKGDEIKLHNDVDNSIWVSFYRPFTFTGYKA